MLSENEAPQFTGDGETPGGPFQDPSASDEASQQLSAMNAGGIQDTHRSNKPEGGGDKKILFLIAACNDNYIRFFNL